jgi:hypothetical protein
LLWPGRTWQKSHDYRDIALGVFAPRRAYACQVGPCVCGFGSARVACTSSQTAPMSAHLAATGACNAPSPPHRKRSQEDSFEQELKRRCSEAHSHLKRGMTEEDANPSCPKIAKCGPRVGAFEAGYALAMGVGGHVTSMLCTHMLAAGRACFDDLSQTSEAERAALVLFYENEKRALVYAFETEMSRLAAFHENQYRGLRKMLDPGNTRRDAF